MRSLARSADLPRSYHVTPQFGDIPRILAYASGLTSDFPLDGHPHCTNTRPKPSLKMRILCLASIVGLVGSAISQAPTGADSYFTTESPIAKAGLLANIGPNGVRSSGANVCRKNPAFHVHLYSSRLESSLPVPVLSIRIICTLGSATRHLYSRLLRINLLLDKILRYAVISITLSTLKPRCNTCVTPVGLSIPAALENQNSTSTALHSQAHGVALSEVCPWIRFSVLQAQYRPLLDGPALRSTTLITYSNWLLAQGNRSFVTETLWPVIQRDLDYIQSEWNQSTSVQLPNDTPCVLIA
jgi:glucoamylase